MKFYQACIFILLSAVVFISCKEKSQELPAGADSLITGLASTVPLNPGTTEFLPADYFDNVEKLDSFQGPQNLSISGSLADGVLTMIPQDGLLPLSILSFYSQGLKYDILLKKSAKVKYDFHFDDPEKKHQQVQILGDINAWNAANTIVEYKDGAWTSSMYLTPGTYGYQLIIDGNQGLDPQNPEKMDNGIGGFNSPLIIQGPAASDLPQLYTTGTGSELIIASEGNSTGIFVFWENSLIYQSKDSGNRWNITIPEMADKMQRSSVRAYAYNEKGIGSDLFIPLQNGKPITDAAILTRDDHHSQIMYFLMVDRFFNGDTANDKPTDDPQIHPRANFHGGDIQGIIQKLKSGYFDSLGMNTIWLSPIPRNPDGAYGWWDKGGVKSKFSSYHGYWPTGLAAVDPRFGNLAELKTLITLAHDRGINVILDFVAHHVHEEHILYQEKKDSGWFTDLHLPDGTLNTERWDDHRLTTWFDVFLPTFRFDRDDVCDMLSDTAMFWLYETGIDGFRHDATKHIDLKFWRALTKKVKAYKRKSGRPVYQVGETYGTPELIASYIQSGMLDAQFDFNLYDAFLQSVCIPDKGFKDVRSRLEQSFAYYGVNHLMGNMSGNQDKTRLMALATGDVSMHEDGKLAGWTRAVDKTTAAGYKKLELMHVLNLSVPGVPCIYYGDEIGLTGGNDPDNRRMMRFDSLQKEAEILRHNVGNLSKLRRSNMALMYGNMRFLDTPASVLGFTRKYFDNEVLVLVNSSAKEQVVEIRIPDYISREKFKDLSGKEVLVKDKKATIVLAPYSYLIANS